MNRTPAPDFQFSTPGLSMGKNDILIPDPKPQPLLFDGASGDMYENKATAERRCQVPGVSPARSAS